MAQIKEDEDNAIARWYPSFAQNFATIKVQLHPLERGLFTRIAAAWRMLISAQAYIDLDRATMHQLAARYNLQKAVNTDDEAKEFFGDTNAAEQAAASAGL